MPKKNNCLIPVEQRLLMQSERANGCLLWTGAASKNGYGIICVNGRSRSVHRLSYETFVGPIPDGLQILHWCNTPRCFEPTHLTPGTQKENVAYAISLGRRPAVNLIPPERRPRGERHAMTRITSEDAREIKRCASNGESYESLGRRFGISGTTARNIALGITWGHVQ